MKDEAPAGEGTRPALTNWRSKLVDQVRGGLDAVGDDVLARFVSELQNAARVFVFGQGREGYMLRAFTMRLMHLGLDAHYLWHPSLPPATRGDRLVTSSATGDLRTIGTLLEIARDHGCGTVLMTATPGTAMSEQADLVIHLPAPSIAEAGQSGINLLGTAFEHVQLVWLDGVVLHLAAARGMGDADLRGRHTNWE